jgi:hypothetical protein
VIFARALHKWIYIVQVKVKVTVIWAAENTPHGITQKITSIFTTMETTNSALK